MDLDVGNEFLFGNNLLIARPSIPKNPTPTPSSSPLWTGTTTGQVKKLAEELGRTEPLG